MRKAEDATDLHSRSRPSGLPAEDGREVRLVGEILVFNPMTNNRSVPKQYRGHPLVGGRYFYTLPPAILDLVVRYLGEGRIDAELLAMERTLSAICGDHASRVGFWQGVAIPSQGLRTNEVKSFSAEDARSVGLNPVQVDHAMRVYKERDVLPLRRAFRGYAGWLVTNRRFLDEQDKLLADHGEAIAQRGTADAGIRISPPAELAGSLGGDPDANPAWHDFCTACEAFLLRWRLQSLAAPYLPVPLQPLMAGMAPWTVVQRLMQVGGLFFLPDTIPLPSRDQLRGMLEHALHRGEQPEHLAEWLHIIRSDNTARNQMDKYARLFEIQHYWRILHARYASALQGNLGRVESALAEAFGVSKETMKADVATIRRRLGTDWRQRAWPI